VTLMKLEHAENKWAFERQRRQFLEEENKKLRTEIAVAGNVQRRSFWQQEESGKCEIYIFIFIYTSVCFWSLHSQKSLWQHCEIYIFFHCDMVK